jgi:hypothetical protein
MTKQNSSKKMKRMKIRGKQRKINMKIHGLSIDIPPELDLPAGAPFEGRPQPKSMQIPIDIEELFGPLIEVATNAWRLKIRMVDSETGEPKEEMHKLYRFVEGLFRGLQQAGIRVVDTVGKIYDSGMPLKVLNFEPVPGLQREEIIETVRPTILWKEQLLRAGEIIVGTPIKEKESNAEDSVEVSKQEKVDSSNLDETIVAPGTAEECSDEADGDSGLSEEDTAYPEKEKGIDYASRQSLRETPPENQNEQNEVYESASQEKENSQDAPANTEHSKQTGTPENEGKE